MKTVGELHINNADLAEHPFRYHLSRLLDHLVPGITVCDADNFILLLLSASSSRASSAVKHSGFRK